MDWDVYIPQRMTGSISMDTEIRNVSGVEQSSPMLVLDVLYHLTDDMNYEKYTLGVQPRDFFFFLFLKIGSRGYRPLSRLSMSMSS